MERAVPSLTVVHHPDAACLGRRLVVVDELVLGRSCETLSAVSDRRLSRAHARVEARGAFLTITDEKSENGTFVDGVRVTSAELAEGSVVGIGSLLLLAHRAPPIFSPPSADGVIGVSHRLAETILQLKRAATLGEPVVLVGETGSGKGYLAEHTHQGRGGELVIVACASIPGSRAHEELYGAGESPGILQGAEGGTLFLDGVDDASPALQAALLRFLDAREVRPLGGGPARSIDTQIIASAARPIDELVAAGTLRADFAARLGASIVVPPLRDRAEDVLVIARAFLEEVSPGARIHPGLALALLRHDWPGNVRELHAVLASTLLDEGTTELRMSERTAAMLARAPAEAPRVTPQSWVVARSGRSFTMPDGSQVSLEVRRTLVALLRAMAVSHEETPGRAITIAEMLTAGWPGERVLPRAGAARVYVAITTLRKMGLRDLLEREGGGYRFDPQQNVRIDG